MKKFGAFLLAGVLAIGALTAAEAQQESRKFNRKHRYTGNQRFLLLLHHTQKS